MVALMTCQARRRSAGFAPPTVSLTVTDDNGIDTANLLHGEWRF